MLITKQVLLILEDAEMLMREYPVCGKVHKQGEKCPLTGIRQREYDVNHHNEESVSFYHSNQRKHMQALVKMTCHGLDMYAFYAEHRLVKGRIAHHIIPIFQEPDRALDMGNLIYVSDSSHKKIHGATATGWPCSIGWFEMRKTKLFFSLRRRKDGKGN